MAMAAKASPELPVKPSATLTGAATTAVARLGVAEAGVTETRLAETRVAPVAETRVTETGLVSRQASQGCIRRREPCGKEQQPPTTGTTAEPMLTTAPMTPSGGT